MDQPFYEKIQVEARIRIICKTKHVMLVLSHTRNGVDDTHNEVVKGYGSQKAAPYR